MFPDRAMGKDSNNFAGILREIIRPIWPHNPELLSCELLHDKMECVLERLRLCMYDSSRIFFHLTWKICNFYAVTEQMEL